ncbi:MAG TPA: sulfurtransferase TusA family protein [Chloroflexota bacterium]|nr:sulfurtransferase TusA family protein [Chloroflexota bacterium]
MSDREHGADGPGTLPRFGADAFYDAGDKGCGDGPLDDIAFLIRKMPAGQTLEIHATEPSVAVDLPAWCRLTGHRMVEHTGDHYLVRRKD